MTNPRGAVSWSAVCDCGISWSYLLTFLLLYLYLGLSFLFINTFNFILIGNSLCLLLSVLDLLLHIGTYLSIASFSLFKIALHRFLTELPCNYSDQFIFVCSLIAT